MHRIPVTVLGATGVVGQRFVRRLANHPQFRIAFLAASERSLGKTYAEACQWQLPGEPYAGLGSTRLVACSPAEAHAAVVFSALDTEPARSIEPEFARAGCFVFSNASAFRMEEDVPLLVPELNPDHLGLVAVQRQRRGWSGAIVCNPNCTTTVALGALGPVYRAFGTTRCLLTSMQALSGAGYPGVSALDGLGNVIPFIRGEEEKVAAEAAKILGSFSGGRVQPAGLTVSAQCNRVPVADGHTLCLNLDAPGAGGAQAVAEAIAGYRPAWTGLYSAPERYARVHEAADRPQPKRDADEGAGMTAQVGRIRECPVLGYKMVVLAHNAERGAAGGSVLNAELALLGGYL